MKYRLDRVVDLSGTALTAAMDHTVLGRIITTIVAIQLSRQGGATVLDRGFVTNRLASKLSDASYALPIGLFVIDQLHVSPTLPGPAGERIVIGFIGKIPGAEPVVEWWTFLYPGGRRTADPALWLADDISSEPVDLAA